MASTDDLVREFDVQQVVDPAPPPNWNVAPTSAVAGILQHGTESSDPVRQLHTLRWGLVPSWSKTRTGAAKMINARIETLASKPAFRAALRRRRLILPAAGYYEWVPVVNSDGEIAKQPYYLHPADGLLAFAGLYEWWHDDAADSWLLSCTIITTPATGPLGEIHDRTPFCLPRQRIADWLDPALTDTTAIEQLLEPMQLDLDARPVSTLVNRVGNNGALLIAGQDRPSPLVIGSPADSV